jgi:hypothetical protein
MATQEPAAAAHTADVTPTGRTAPRWAGVLAILLGLFFLGLGVMRLLPIETDQEMFLGWGVPLYLRTGAALAEALAGALILTRRWRVLGGVGLFTIMVAAGTLHTGLEHSLALTAAINGIPALLAAVVAWTHRHQLAQM